MTREQRGLTVTRHSIAAVVEQSSAATEQMSAQVEEMSAQELASTAEHLRELVDRFKLDNATKPAAASPLASSLNKVVALRRVA